MSLIYACACVPLCRFGAGNGHLLGLSGRSGSPKLRMNDASVVRTTKLGGNVRDRLRLGNEEERSGQRPKPSRFFANPYRLLFRAWHAIMTGKSSSFAFEMMKGTLYSELIHV